MLTVNLAVAALVVTASWVLGGPSGGPWLRQQMILAMGYFFGYGALFTAVMSYAGPRLSSFPRPRQSVVFLAVILPTALLGSLVVYAVFLASGMRRVDPWAFVLAHWIGASAIAAAIGFFIGMREQVRAVEHEAQAQVREVSLVKEQALQLAEARLTALEALGEIHQNTQAILKRLPANGSHRAALRILSRVGTRVHPLAVADITHFCARDKLTFAFIKGKAHVVDLTIKRLEQSLAAHGFFRVHRHTLVNLAAVEELSIPAGGATVRLKGEPHVELPVARDRAAAFKKALELL